MRFTLAALVLLAATIPLSAHALPEGPVVVAGTSQYAPAALGVPLGTPVTFLNPGIPFVSPPHTWITANTLQDALLARGNDLADTNCVVDGEVGEDANPDTCHVSLVQGASHVHVFQQPGTYFYFCEIHQQQRMLGLVTVA